MTGKTGQKIREITKAMCDVAHAALLATEYAFEAFLIADEAFLDLLEVSNASSATQVDKEATELAHKISLILQKRALESFTVSGDIFDHAVALFETLKQHVLLHQGVLGEMPKDVINAMKEALEVLKYVDTLVAQAAATTRFG